MQKFFLLITFVALSQLSAQDDFLGSLAVEVCNCLNERGTGLSETSASGCMDATAMRHEERLRYRYGLMIASPGQQDQLADLLLDDLLKVCPVLNTFRPENTQREFRWADGRPGHERTTPDFSAPKRPEADTSSNITSEPPVVWAAAGKLIAPPRSRRLRLRTETGKELTFELPTTVARKRDFDPGDEISLSYRREWRLAERQIVLVVVKIDK